MNGTFPTYFAFLSVVAILPALFLYRAVGHLTNWPAVAVTTLYVLVTSVIWEVTLAIPRAWWGYEPSGMSGKGPFLASATRNFWYRPIARLCVG